MKLKPSRGTATAGISAAEGGNAYVVLEQVLQRCVDDANELLAKPTWSEFEHGQALELYSVLDWARIQADIFLEVSGADALTAYVRAFDPETLLRACGEKQMK